MSAATRGERTNPIGIRNFARFALCHDQILARYGSPLHVRRARTSPAIDAMTIDQCKWPTLQRIACPATNASSSELHTIWLAQSNHESTRMKKNSCSHAAVRRLCPRLSLFTVRHWTLSVGRFPDQFEFEMRFRSVWFQRLPLFDQVIAIFEKELETIDVFRPFFQVSDVLEDECDRRGIFSKPCSAQSRLIPVARVQRHEQGMNTTRMINGDKPRIAFQNSMP